MSTRFTPLHKIWYGISEIGKGGFGCVFKARDLKQHNRLVAIKQIDLSALNPSEIIEATDSFNREVSFLSTLSHPNLPKIYAHFTDSTHWYMVMQYIRGRTLEDYLKRSRRGYLSVSRVVKIGFPIAVFVTLIYQVISLFRPGKRMTALGVLAILLLMFLLIALGVLPPLFQWFPHGGSQYP